jgi:hypothetical protein
MTIDREESPYRRGNRYSMLPIPMIEEHCHPVEAGAVRLIVESRALTNAILDETYAGIDMPHQAVSFDDHGASLHVCGADDGLEHLRFDCFEHEPHYHYIEHRTGDNVVVRIDEVAVGDPIEFTLRCVGERLPEMLENAGQPELAARTRADLARVQAALVTVRDLMARAR